MAFILEKMPHAVSALLTRIGGISLELYIVHEHLYSMIDDLAKTCGTYVSYLLAVTSSFVAAIILYQINKKYLQRIFNPGPPSSVTR